MYCAVAKRPAALFTWSIGVVGKEARNGAFVQHTKKETLSEE